MTDQLRQAAQQETGAEAFFLASKAALWAQNGGVE
jgi:hypothetical protein